MYLSLYLYVFVFVFFFECGQFPPCGPVPLRVTLSALVALGASDQVLRGSCVCLCLGVFVFAFQCVFVLYVSQTPSRQVSPRVTISALVAPLFQFLGIGFLSVGGTLNLSLSVDNSQSGHQIV